MHSLLHILINKLKPFQLSMKAKLVVSFTIILLIVAGVSAFHLNQVNLIKQQHTYQNDQLRKQKLSLELKLKANELDAIKSGFIISKKSELVESYTVKREEFYELVKEVADTASNAEERNWSAKLTNTSTEYTAAFDQAVNLVSKKTLGAAELNSQLENIHGLSQLHKEYIFELVDNFNKAFTRDAAKAVEDSNSLLNDTASVALIALIFVVLITIGTALLLIRSFVRPISKLQQAVQSIAGGDLRNKINSTSKDELGALSNDFDHMIDQVRSMLAHTQSIASYLSEHSKSFQSISGSTASANTEVLRAIQEISTGAEQQAYESDQNTLIITDLGKEMELISEYAERVQYKSREAAFNTHTGSTSMATLKQASQISEAVLNKVYQATTSLCASSTQINKIVNTISEISQKTNVLALNATIEAARAGIHGRGFSVIAEEVRYLSMQTNESSKSIAAIIHSLLQQTKDLELHMEEAQHSFLQQNSKMAESMDAFNQIRSSMDALSLDINQIHKQIEYAQQKNEQLVDSVQIVAAIAQETAAGVQEVHSTSIQQHASIQQVASQADDIMLLSQKLFQEVNKFQIGSYELEETVANETLEQTELITNENDWDFNSEELSEENSESVEIAKPTVNEDDLIAHQLASDTTDETHAESEKMTEEQLMEEEKKKLMPVG